MTGINRYSQVAPQDFDKEVRVRRDFFIYQDKEGTYGFNWEGFYEGCKELLSEARVLFKNKTLEDAINIHAELSAP